MILKKCIENMFQEILTYSFLHYQIITLFRHLSFFFLCPSFFELYFAHLKGCKLQAYARHPLSINTCIFYGTCTLKWNQGSSLVSIEGPSHPFSRLLKQARGTPILTTIQWDAWSCPSYVRLLTSFAIFQIRKSSILE